MVCVSHAACICDVPLKSDWIPELEGDFALPYAMVLSISNVQYSLLSMEEVKAKLMPSLVARSAKAGDWR